MAAQCESAASPPIFRPEARRDLSADFILAQNTPAGGPRSYRNTNRGFTQ
jgi:hypothetical protein